MRFKVGARLGLRLEYRVRARARLVRVWVWVILTPTSTMYSLRHLSAASSIASLLLLCNSSSSLYTAISNASVPRPIFICHIREACKHGDTAVVLGLFEISIPLVCGGGGGVNSVLHVTLTYLSGAEVTPPTKIAFFATFYRFVRKLFQISKLLCF